MGSITSGAAAPNAADADYSVGVAAGGTAGSQSGGNGRVVIFGC